MRTPGWGCQVSGVELVFAGVTKDAGGRGWDGVY